MHQSLWEEIRGRRSYRSHSELRKYKIVVEEDIGVVSTKNCRSCCLHDGMHAETLKIHLPKVSEISSSLALVFLWPVRLTVLFLEHFQPAISTAYCFLFSVSV